MRHALVQPLSCTFPPHRWYALDLNAPNCTVELSGGEPELRATLHDTVPSDALFVHPTGKDTNPGTRSAPLQSIQLAMDVMAKRTGANKTVVLRGGTHYIADTIYLGPQHSHITVSNFVCVLCRPR